MTEDSNTGLPWTQAASPGPVRRKVAWGSGASFDESAAPHPRSDSAATPQPAFGNWEPTVYVSDDEAATDTARLHAGVAQPSAQQRPAEVVPVEEAASAADAAESGDLSSVFEDLFGDDEVTDAAATVGPDMSGPVDVGAETVEPASMPEDPEDDEAEGSSAAEIPDGAASDGSDDVSESSGDVSTFPELTADTPSTDRPHPEPDVAEPSAPAALDALFDDDTDIADVADALLTTPSDDPETGEPDAEPSAAVDSGQAAAESHSELEPEPDVTAAPEPATSDTMDAPPAEPARGFDLAAHRAALEASRVLTQAEVQAKLENGQQYRYTDSDYYYQMVDRILSLGRGGDPTLQGVIRGIELTHDPALDAEQRLNYQSAVEPRMAEQNIQIGNPQDRDTVFDIAYDEVLGIGPLGPLWRDPSISEILISGPNRVTVERHGRLEITPVRFRSLQHLEATARTLTGLSDDDRAVSRRNPLVTIQLPSARVQLVWSPLAVNKVAISIRKFGALMDMAGLLGHGSLSADMAGYLRDAVAARATILVSGGTGSGKTTCINALSEFIPDSERVVTIEDARELQLRNTHVEPLLTKEAASADDTVLFGQDLLLKAALRMRPDRIIVGEIRDGKGCMVMLDAANTGHDGTMTTVHATSPELALSRMSRLLRRAEVMPTDVAREEVATAIDVVVQIVRNRGRRYVSHISVVDKAATRECGSFQVVDMFTGVFDAESAAPKFAQVGRLGPDTDLAHKMLDAGIDPTVWE